MGAADLVTAPPAAPLDAVFERVGRAVSDGPEHARYYGGFRFDGGRPPDDGWAPFGGCRLVRRSAACSPER